MAKTDTKVTNPQSQALYEAFKNLKVDVNSINCERPPESQVPTICTLCKESSKEWHQRCKRCASLHHSHLSSSKNVTKKSHKLIHDAKLTVSNPIKEHKSSNHRNSPKSWTRMWPRTRRWLVSSNPDTLKHLAQATQNTSIFGGCSTSKSSTYADLSQKLSKCCVSSNRPAYLSRQISAVARDPVSVEFECDPHPVAVEGETDQRPGRSCSQQAHVQCDDCSLADLAGYFDDCVHIPKNMSVMAEMMYL